jgi:hypothetical protein
MGMVDFAEGLDVGTEIMVRVGKVSLDKYRIRLY